MSMEDSDLRERLRLAKERIAALELELTEAIDMRDLIRAALSPSSGIKRPPDKTKRMLMDEAWIAAAINGPDLRKR